MQGWISLTKENTSKTKSLLSAVRHWFQILIFHFEPEEKFPPHPMMGNMQINFQILYCITINRITIPTLNQSVLDHNDPSKPSHRSTNGPEPSKTIESDGRKIKKPSKNHWWQWSDRQKTFNGDGLLKNHWKFTMVSSKPLKLTMVSLKPLNLSMVLSNQYSLKRMELSCGHNYNLELALL